MIFSKARQEAPCYLVFEDLDSIVSDRVRSYFLNEVDGLNTNDGILASIFETLTTFIQFLLC